MNCGTRLQRSRFTRYIDPEDRDLFLAQLLRISEWIAITNSKLGCRDEDDDKLLETALLGEADCLVTGGPGPTGDVTVPGDSDHQPRRVVALHTATKVKSPHGHSATYRAQG